MKIIFVYCYFTVVACLQCHAVCAKEGEEAIKLNIVSIKGRSSCASQMSGVQHLKADVYAAVSYYLTGMPCGAGLWYNVAYLNMSDSAQNCPTNWRQYNTNGVRACGRLNDNDGCSSVHFPTGHRYNKVCGRIIGYQVASPGAFHIYAPVNSIDDVYVDGISVTYGSPRKHIWTYAAGVTEGTHHFPQADCPCAVSNPSQRRLAPDFVGNDYFCESGNPTATGSFVNGHLYSRDPLWDGIDCEGQCCSDGKSPPWFNVLLTNATTEDIEVRICGDQSLYDEDNPLSLLELYVHEY